MVPTTKCECPKCHVKFDGSVAVAGTVECPVCGAAFKANVAASPATASAPSSSHVPHSTTTTPDSPAPAGGGRLALVAVFVLAIVGVVGYFAWPFLKPTDKPMVSTDHSADAPPAPMPAPSSTSSPMPAPTLAPEPPAPVVAPPPASSLPPEMQAKVNAAITRGEAHLRVQLTELVASASKPPANIGPHYLGTIALEAWTLLNCGLPASDPTIQKTAEILRARSGQIEWTYHVSLALLLFDRLGDPRDRGLIQTLALRLVAGQHPIGNWNYHCGIMPSADETKLLAILKATTWDKLGQLHFRPGAKVVVPDSLKKVGVVERLDNKPYPPAKGDNSNTQFAILALWTAKRHNLPVQPALMLTDRYFRDLQNKDGGWGYAPVARGQHCASMTCSALLALAVTRSIGVRPADAAKDAAIANGLHYLGGTIRPSKRMEPWGKVFGAAAFGDYYYLWSLERVAMIYDLHTIGGQDWYAWAAEVIVEHQSPGGEWVDHLGRSDSCFALLVLKRVNVVQDLTSNIKDLIRAGELQDLPAQRK